LLEAFGRTADPDLALATFDRVIAELPAGVQLFSLLAANPSLLRLVADIVGTAPRLARIIARRPRLLDLSARHQHPAARQAPAPALRRSPGPNAPAGRHC